MEVCLRKKKKKNGTDDCPKSPETILKEMRLSGNISQEVFGILWDSIGAKMNRNGKQLHHNELHEFGISSSLDFKPPPRVSDAWFILNLFSAVPFLSSLSYGDTMEVLEVAQVLVFRKNDVVVPSQNRSDFLCVVWEGTCTERNADEAQLNSPEWKQSLTRRISSSYLTESDRVFSGTNQRNPKVWHAGDWSAPSCLQPESTLRQEDFLCDIVAASSQGVQVILINMQDLHKILKGGSPLYRKFLGIHGDKGRRERELQNPQASILDKGKTFLETINYNSALRNMAESQKRHLESLAEGPRFFETGKAIWSMGSRVDFAFLVLKGTTRFCNPKRNRQMRRCSTGMLSEQPFKQSNGSFVTTKYVATQDKELKNISANSEYARLETILRDRADLFEDDVHEHSNEFLATEAKLRHARDNFANKVLGRLYSRRAYTSNLIFSRGHFLSDTSRMVSGSLAHTHGHIPSPTTGKTQSKFDHLHGSELIAGPFGCVVLVFPRASLISFLELNPGILLNLLGTQALV